jgi:parvulin-like peptidyl-prolyl isomerase
MIAVLLAITLVSCGREAAPRPTAAPTAAPAGAPAAQSTAAPAPTAGASQPTAAPAPLAATTVAGPATSTAQNGIIVARVDNANLTRQDLDQRLDRIMKVQPQGSPSSRLDIERQLVNQFVEQYLTLSIARQRGVSVSDKQIDDKIAEFRDRIAQAGGTLEEAVQTDLGMPGSTSPEFRDFTKYIVAQQKIAETLVTTDTVRQQLTDQFMAEANKQVDQVHSAHILIRVEQSADAATTAAAEVKAKQVIDRLNKGEKFEDLAKELSEDPGSATNGGDLGWVSQGQFVPEFDKAIFEDLKPGETTRTPIKTQFGYHVIKVIGHELRTPMTEEEAKQAIEQSLPQQVQQQRAQAFQKLIEDERAKAKAEGRLVEPVYPDPISSPAEPTVAPTPQSQTP